jgi:TPR repeat protein
VDAVKWFTLAAGQEYPDSEYYLGVCYNNGQGVEKDRSIALKLLRKAKKSGCAEAAEALRVLSE